MKSNPYNGISDEVASVVRPLLAGCDQYHKTHRARLLRTIDLLYRSSPTGKVLELGTSGLIPIALRRLFPDLIVHGTHFDTSRPPISSTSFTHGGEEMTVLTACVDLEFEPLPMSDETYDVVLCCEVLEHMEIDPMFMMSEVNRVTKTGGSLLLTTPNIASSWALTKILRGYDPYFFMQYHKSREYHRHNYEYSIHSLWRILSAAGFDPTVWTEDLFEDGAEKTVNKLINAGFEIHHTGDNLLSWSKKISPVVDRWPDGLYV